LGCADVIEHSIVMEDEQPVHQRQFRVPFAHEEVLYESGAIEVSRSPYNSVVFCVATKQLPNAAPGDPVPLRVVLDFRAVNLKSLPNRYCVKEVRECLDEVGKSRLLLPRHELPGLSILLEKAAACWGINYFDTYLTPPKQFTLCTDHRPLETMSTVHKKTLNNLQLLMLKFNFVIEYWEGWRNTVAEALSRTHAAAPICVIKRSGRRTAEDNSVPAYRGAEEDEEEDQDPAIEDDGEIPSRAIVAQPPQATLRRDLESTTRTKELKWSRST
jgi:hypothetical protein